MGHTLFGFADEYESLQGCGEDRGRDRPPSFLGIRLEPSEPNITLATKLSELKWRDLVAATTPIPTWTNPGCTMCDPQASPVSTGTVGAFDGASTYGWLPGENANGTIDDLD